MPSATEIVAELGLAGSLVGRSEECDWPPEVAAVPVVTAARIDSAALGSRAIDAAVRAAVRDGSSLYALDAALVEELRPDVIVTQDLCTVCAVSSDDVNRLCAVEADVVSLDPRDVDEVLAAVEALGDRLGVRDRARAVVERAREEIAEAGDLNDDRHPADQHAVVDQRRKLGRL